MNYIKALFSPWTSSHIPIWVIGLPQFILFVALWVLYPPADIPSLGMVGDAWHTLAASDGLLPELWTSSKTIATALFLSTVISLGLTVLSTSRFFKPIAAAVSSLRFLGFVGLTFLFTLWTTGATSLKLSLLTFVITTFMLTNLLSEVDGITREHIDYLKTMKFKGWRITWETVVLGKLHVLLDLVRQNAAMGWTALTMVEGITRSQGGIGALLMNQDRHFNLAAILAIQLTILAYGLIQDYVLGFILQTACPYASLTRSK